MEILDKMLNKLETDVDNMKDGLQPGNLAYWYVKIIKETREIAPSWLEDKISFIQDPIMTQKFKLDISKRALKYFSIIIHDNLGNMPYSTRLYFLKVLEITQNEYDKSLV